MVVPDASPPRLDYWLTRKKVADRIRIARRDATYRSDAADRRLHGPRQWAILNLRWAPSAEGGWFDVESQPLHRLDRTAESKKRLQCENFRGRAVEDVRKAWQRFLSGLAKPFRRKMARGKSLTVPTSAVTQQ
jgi:hypothetical protein